MGEYAKHNGQHVKIGTCEDMYYLRFDQRHQVRPEQGSVDPVKDAHELRFRFPWPDEDSIQPGHFDDFNRAIAVDGFEQPEGVEHYGSCAGGTAAKLTAQRFRPTVGLVPVLRCNGCGAMWREEDRARIEELAMRLRSMADREGAPPLSRAFYNTVADRVLAGIAQPIDVHAHA